MSYGSGKPPLFRSAFTDQYDQFKGQNKRPVVFDILGSDYQTSLLPEDYKMVLHVNPTSMKMSSAKVIQRTQTRGGFVEQHWGEGARSISFDMATGGFMRLYTGLSNITGNGGLTNGGYDSGGVEEILLLMTSTLISLHCFITMEWFMMIGER